MRTIIVSALCLFAGLPAAMAGGAPNHGSAVIGFVAGEVSGNQGSTFKQFNETKGSGSSAGSSASGTVFNLNAGEGSGVKYSSYGTAHSDVSVTPFGVVSNSSHDAGAFGKAWGENASFSASNQTFGQSNGNSAFTSEQKTKTTAYNNSEYKAIAVVGFASFEGGYTNN